jgi:hypothetical protein
MICFAAEVRAVVVTFFYVGIKELRAGFDGEVSEVVVRGNPSATPMRALPWSRGAGCGV